MDGSSSSINSILVSILFAGILRFTVVFFGEVKKKNPGSNSFLSLAPPPSADEDESNGAKPFLIVYFFDFFLCKDKVALD